VCEKKYVFDLKREDGQPLEAVAACPARGNDPLLASLSAKQAADDKIYQTEVAALGNREAAKLAAAQAEADAKAAAKARGEAIGGAVSGLFGGGQQAVAQPAPAPAPAPSSGSAPPLPMAAPKGG
jgi:hypothetical protein